MKLVPGYPDYVVSRDGEVWRAWQRQCKRMKLWCCPEGYQRVGLYRQGQWKWFNVHQLVLLAYVGPPGPGQVCRHLDGNPANNRLENLAWGTVQENVRDAVRHHRHHSRSKLTEGEVRDIRRLHARGVHYTRTAAFFGVGPLATWGILKGKTWQWVS